MKDQLFYRFFELDRAKVNKEARSVEVSFSSEAPVERWIGKEILLHGPNNVDLSRLRKMGAVLMNHNPSIIVGPIKNPRIEDRRGKATVVFDEDEDGERAFTKVNSGSLRGVSVGYMINKARRVEEKEEYENIKGPALVALRWTPYEISLTPIPADATVGVGRDLTQSLDGIDILYSDITRTEKEGYEMDESQVRQIVSDMLNGVETTIVERIQTTISDQAKPKFAVTAEQAMDLKGRAAAISPEAKDKIVDMIIEGRTEAEIKNVLLDMATRKPDAVDTGAGPGSDGIGADTPGSMAPFPGSISSFTQIDDDIFFRGLKSPAPFSIQ